MPGKQSLPSPRRADNDAMGYRHLTRFMRLVPAPAQAGRGKTSWWAMEIVDFGDVFMILFMQHLKHIASSVSQKLALDSSRFSTPSNG